MLRFSPLSLSAAMVVVVAVSSCWTCLLLLPSAFAFVGVNIGGGVATSTRNRRRIHPQVNDIIYWNNQPGIAIPVPSAQSSSLIVCRLSKNSNNIDSNKNENEEEDKATTTTKAATSSPLPPPPLFNGKRVLPGSIVLSGLKAAGSRVPAVYALYATTKPKTMNDGVVHVGVTQDLGSTLLAWQQQHQQQAMSGVRALSFTISTPIQMQEMAQEWKRDAIAAGSPLLNNPEWIDTSATAASTDEEDDDDWDEEDDDNEDAEASATFAPQPSVATSSTTTTTTTPSKDTATTAVVSPFVDAKTTTATTTSGNAAEAVGGLEFTVESVDRVLDEVRPYLVADGGNVAVVGVVFDEEPRRREVQLELQGACGSCASSTVTMQMGIERVLRETFGSDITVVQVTPTSAAAAEPLESRVQEELNRLSQAVIAMGGVARLVSVEADTGVVQLQFRGSNKLKSGLELALLDVPGINAVQFISSL